MFNQNVSIVSSSSARRIAAAVCLLGLSVGTGCSASADLPEVVVTRSDIEFYGVGVFPGISDVSQSATTTFDHPSDFELPDGLNPELHPLAATLQANDSIDDLSFLEEFSITLASRAPDAPEPVRVAGYVRDDEARDAGRSIELVIEPDLDVLSYWDTNEAYYEVTLAGILPPDDWSIDVTFAFSGRLSMSSSD